MNNLLLGAIVGDIFGQPYEFKKNLDKKIVHVLTYSKIRENSLTIQYVQ